ncbi:integrator complex subunit 6-like [Tamandua tetradactyla]|uniref:integrator complex subunit 6-like n=1 Tax=Tamandua tetradactyla TaxID=48850 RepID=UPI0040547F02
MIRTDITAQPLYLVADDIGIHNAYEKMENGQTPTDGVSSKYVLLELINMAGDGIPPQNLDSLPNDITVSRQYGVNDKIGSNARLQGAEGRSTSLDDTKVTAASILGSMRSKSPISPAAAKIINDGIKYQFRKEIGKFGRKFERIFILFEEVQGPPEVKKQFVEFTIKEATRFKRQVLIQDLEKIPPENPDGQRRQSVAGMCRMVMAAPTQVSRQSDAGPGVWQWGRRQRPGSRWSVRCATGARLADGAQDKSPSAHGRG